MDINEVHRKIYGEEKPLPKVENKENPYADERLTDIRTRPWLKEYVDIQTQKLESILDSCMRNSVDSMNKDNDRVIVNHLLRAYELKTQLNTLING